MVDSFYRCLPIWIVRYCGNSVGDLSQFRLGRTRKPSTRIAKIIYRLSCCPYEPGYDLNLIHSGDQSVEHYWYQLSRQRAFSDLFDVYLNLTLKVRMLCPNKTFELCAKPGERRHKITDLNGLGEIKFYDDTG